MSRGGLSMSTSIRIVNTLCTGCKTCYEVCPMDVFGFDDRNGFPTVEHPDECWYCGACIFDCPVKGAIHLELPMPCL